MRIARACLLLLIAVLLPLRGALASAGPCGSAGAMPCAHHVSAQAGLPAGHCPHLGASAHTSGPGEGAQVVKCGACAACIPAAQALPQAGLPFALPAEACIAFAPFVARVPTRVAESRDPPPRGH